MTLQARENLLLSLRNAIELPAEERGEVLTTVLEGLRPADIAEAMNQLYAPESLLVFNELDNARAAEVLGDLDSDTANYITRHSAPKHIADLLDILPMDDAAEVVAEASAEQAQSMLANLEAVSPADAAEVRELLSYAPKTAGRLMTDKFLRVPEHQSVEETFVAIRRADPEVEILTDIFVTEPGSKAGEERLIGVVSLRQLVCAVAESRLSALMTRDLITVTVDTDQEDVARLISKYDFLALPVLDRHGNLAGIITVDDVIDVLVEEFTEDYLKSVGSDAAEMDRCSPWQVAKLRLPWLLGTMVIELMAGGVIAHFDNVLKQIILLASFMPVISAISGNVGLQAAAIVVRGLETGHVTLGNWRRAVSKELSTALMMAVACGIVLGTVGAVWSKHMPFGLVIGVAMTASMLTAGFMGTAIPMLSKRLGFDPAATAGPFETAFQDVVGFAVFLWLASLLLQWMK